MSEESFFKSRAQLEARQHQLLWLMGAGCLIPIEGVDLIDDDRPCAILMAAGGAPIAPILVRDLDDYYRAALQHPEHVALAWAEVHQSLPDETRLRNLRNPYESPEDWAARHNAALATVRKIRGLKC